MLLQHQFQTPKASIDSTQNPSAKHQSEWETAAEQTTEANPLEEMCF